MKTQEQIVLEHLRKNGEITSWDAITMYGITRLAAIISRLRKSHKIKTDIVVKKKGERIVRYAKYTLEK